MELPQSKAWCCWEMYLCPSTGQEENNDKMAFASVERSGQWFVKVPEQKHRFPSTSRICILGRLGSVFCLMQTEASAQAKAPSERYKVQKAYF